MKSFGFPSKMKLKSSPEFRHVMNWRVKLVDNGSVAFLRPNSLGWSRLGVSVGKKHGNAIRRNQLKRLVREAFRLSQSDWVGGYDLVFIPSVAASQDALAIRQFFGRLCDWSRTKGSSSGGRHGPGQ